MGKNLSTRIAERLASTPTHPKLSNRAVFLALRPEISQALHDGWRVRTIWETLVEEGKIGVGYQTFRQYIKQFIDPPWVMADISATTANYPMTEKKPLVTSSPLAGFTFHTNPKKEELL